MDNLHHNVARAWTRLRREQGLSEEQHVDAINRRIQSLGLGFNTRPLNVRSYRYRLRGKAHFRLVELIAGYEALGVRLLLIDSAEMQPLKRDEQIHPLPADPKAARASTAMVLMDLLKQELSADLP